MIATVNVATTADKNSETEGSEAAEAPHTWTGRTKWNAAKLTAKLTRPVSATIRHSRAGGCADELSAIFASKKARTVFPNLFFCS